MQLFQTYNTDPCTSTLAVATHGTLVRETAQLPKSKGTEKENMEYTQWDFESHQTEGS